MSKRAVQTDRAPAAVGPYNQAIVANGLAFLAGQVPLDPATGRLVDSDDVRDHARRVLENLEAVLEASGSSLGRAVKVTVYLTDIADYAAVNEVYGEYFGDDPPARSAVAVAALPAGARVEMDVIALA